MLDLYLIRHAESVMNEQCSLIGGRTETTPLTEFGKKQAELLGKRLTWEGIIFDKVYASPATRTKETVEIICSFMAYPFNRIIYSEQLYEISQGEWEGKPRKEIYTKEMLAQINANNWEFHPPNGESQRDVEERMHNYVKKEALTQQGRVGIFGHSMAFKCLLRSILDSTPKMTYKIVLDNTSITHLKYNDLGWHIISLNDIGHLAGVKKQITNI